VESGKWKVESFVVKYSLFVDIVLLAWL